jgi:flagellar hook-length control protein FliK
VIESTSKAVVSTATVVQNTLPNANTKANLPVSNTVISPLVPMAEPEGAKLALPADNNKVSADTSNMTPPVMPDHHTKTQLTSDFAASQQAVAAALSTEPLLTEQKQPLQQENKFTNALTELGQLINNHTAQHANPDVGQSNNIYTNTTDSLKNIARPEFEPRIELPSVVLNSLNQETYNANIKIYPPELGRVMAKLKVDKNNAELMILTENNVVKQIIETNLPELRQNFQNADITLTSINVQTAADNASGSEDHRNSQSNQTDAESGSDLPGAAALAEPTTARTIDSIIDTYA